MKRGQNINLPLGGGRIAVSNLSGGLVAGRSGAVNTGVLLFVSGSVPLTQFGIELTNDADDGTSLRIWRPGIYMAELGGTVIATNTVVVGMSINQVAGLAGDPAFANAGTLDVLTATAPAGNTASFKITTPIVVTKDLAGDPSAGGVVLRFLGSDGAAGAPAGLTQAAAYYRVTRLATIG